jgi:hypothetical protein
VVSNNSPGFANISTLFIRKKWLWILLAIAPPFLVYLFTAAPTIYWLDSAELTTGAYTLGIVHGPGSPLYLLIGYIFAQLPIGDIGYRLNLMSVVSSTLTILFLYLIIYYLTRQRLLSLTTSWFIAFTYYVWNPALSAELYSLQGCFLVGLLFLALKWREQQQSWQLYLLAFLFGLGLGNHLSLILLLPGFALLALSVPLLWQRPHWLLLGTVFGLLGASVYLYLPLRFLAEPGLNYATEYWGVDLASWSGFWWMVTGRMFNSLFFSVPSEALPGEILKYGHHLWSNFIGLGSLIGLWGLISDFRRRPVFHLSLLIMFVSYLIFYIPYAAPDRATMLLPSYLIWGIWFGLGIYTLSERFTLSHRVKNVTIWSTLVLALTLSNLVINFSYANKGQDWSARERGEEIFAALEPKAIYLGSWIDIPILEYLQIVESQRPDVKLVNVVFTSDSQGLLVVTRGLYDDIPVYTSIKDYLHHLGFEQDYDADCRCYRMLYNQSASTFYHSPF